MNGSELLQETLDGRREIWRRRLSSYGLVFALLIICVLLSLRTPQFLTVGNLVNVIRQISINGILAVGVTFVLLTGGVDLSLGSLVALTGVVAAWFAQKEQLPFIVPVLCGILAGAACGLVNGVVITFGRVAPFIATLGMMSAARGLAYLIAEGKPVSGLQPAFTQLGGEVVGLPIPVLVLFGVTILSAVLLSRMRLGRHVYAVGGNEKAARASGLNVSGVKLFAYSICGALAGLAGVVLAARTTTGQPNAGVGYELDAIAAVVVGGTSLAGGMGGVGGTILGALLIGVLNNGLDLLGVSSYVQMIVKGGLIVAAVWLDRRDTE
jgi:inositol transport system permease protein